MISDHSTWGTPWDFPWTAEKRNTFWRRVAATHPETDCIFPKACAVHNPSNHHMNQWPQHFDGHKVMTYRICEHGFNHPDPDDLQIRTGIDTGKHQCCEHYCCLPKNEFGEIPDDVDLSLYYE